MKGRLDFKDYVSMWEDAAANSVGGGGVSLPSDAMPKKLIKRHKDKVKVYDGRTREARKFVERILARRATRENNKKST